MPLKVKVVASNPPAVASEGSKVKRSDDGELPATEQVEESTQEEQA